MTDTDAIERRLEKITPGEWLAIDGRQVGVERISIYCPDRGRTHSVVARLENTVSDRPLDDEDVANADFIAHAPSDIRHLLEALAEARREIVRLQSDCEQYDQALGASATARQAAEARSAALETAAPPAGPDMRDEMQRIADDYGLNHTSKWCRDIARAALSRLSGAPPDDEMGGKAKEDRLVYDKSRRTIVRAEDPTKTGMFVLHSCWKCGDGARPCIVGNPRQCEYPHARDD